MTSSEERILKTLRRDSTFLAALATCNQDGQPWVRYVVGVVGDDLTMRFPTFVGTKKVAHIRRHPEVHVTCGDTSNLTPGTYLQIEAHAEIADSTEERVLCWTPRLEKWFDGPEDPKYAVVRVVPKRIQCLPIGGGEPPQSWEAGNASRC